MKDNVRIIASPRSWIEGEAIRQLEKTAELDGIEFAIGLPDIHPGRGNPVGAVFAGKEIIYPHLVGNDVGCGVALFSTDLKRTKFRGDRWTNRLAGLEGPWDGNTALWLSEHGIESAAAHHSLGTIGGGNHFAELQSFEKIYAQDIFNTLNIDSHFLMVLVHSGSRGIGESLLRSHADKYGARGLNIGSSDAREYLVGHDYAVQWAHANRSLIAYRMSRQLGGECEKAVDLCHNSILPIEHERQILWLHRKGAAPSDLGPVVIPGTRGSLTYLVMPHGDHRMNLWSLAHGAGRKWNRSAIRERLKGRYTAKSLTRSDLGGYVICEDKELLFEEAPQAYKNIEIVIEDMVEAGLISVIATLRPLITYKVRERI